jgi:ubiquinone/menaquinone biosynthesis C-methylase UbiE
MTQQVSQQTTAPVIGADAREDAYFDLMADMDFTKHIGGYAATQALAALCDIGPGVRVLDVGCGVGITPCFLAQEYGCEVVGVDLRPRMIERATARAAQHGLADRVSFQTADAQSLPFDDHSFDVVLAESVLSFLPDKVAGLREWWRVARSGGQVGLTEAVWLREPPPHLKEIEQTFGSNLEIMYPAEWAALLTEAGFVDLEAQTHEISMRTESRDRIRRLGCRHLMMVWLRALNALLARPKYRYFMREAMGSRTGQLMQYWGYGVWAARKPEAG